MADPDEKTPEKDGSVLTEVTNTPVPEVKFELLKNYKEKNIPSVYGQGEEKEHYCNVLLNSENQIEYYTYSKDKDGRHFYKYTLIEEAGGDGDFLESPYWECPSGKEGGRIVRGSGYGHREWGKGSL